MNRAGRDTGKEFGLGYNAGHIRRKNHDRARGEGHMRNHRAQLMAGTVLLVLAVAYWGRVGAQSGPKTLNPGAWPYPDSYDELLAAPKDHKLLYENGHVRLIEVIIRPGETANMHGHPYSAVIAYDAALPATKNSLLDPGSAQNGQGGSRGTAPAGTAYPTCSTTGPQAPHAPANNDTFPYHTYRIEFKRVDGADFAKNWKAWYPYMLDPLKPVKDVVPGPGLGEPLSKDWPFPMAYDSISAAPNNHKLLFEDGHVRFLEVIIRPGETENMHGHPYPSVFARDSVQPMGTNVRLLPDSPLNGQGGGRGPAPAGYDYPSCSTMGPQAPHAATNTSDFPYHFYRLEFKRVDGEEFKTNWKAWYPWMDAPTVAQNK